jgi:DNA-directed RNA polymerase specialized sigma subunit
MTRQSKSEAIGWANHLSTAPIPCDSSHAVRISAEQNNNMFSGQSCAQLLAQRMAQLPPISKKIMALYYYENMQPAELAACFGLSEDSIRQILLQTLGLLRTYSRGLAKTPRLERKPPL